MRRPTPIPKSVNPLKRFAGTCFQKVAPVDGTLVLGRQLHRRIRLGGLLVGTVGGAAALTLAGVLTLAAVIAGLAAALALAGILPFAGMLFFVGLQDPGGLSSQGRNALAGAGGDGACV